jgi:dTDP-4-amino-4,6-dideoxygalactose transaminase
MTAAGVFLGFGKIGCAGIVTQGANEPAILGGTPVRTEKWFKWPIWNQNAEASILDVLRSGNWWRGRGGKIEEFEEAYASLIGAKRCLATASGTTALMTSLDAAGVDAGDEVLVAPYTFIATYNAVFCMKALPVFVDTDPETFTMNPAKIEEKINDRTKAILPVHIYGLPANMDGINELAQKHDLAVIEDACQAWLAEYRNRRCGTLGDLGCFSFQNSKNLPAGEGGAVTGNNDELMDRCFARHNHGRPHGSIREMYSLNGSNYRMQQFQAAILLSQMKRIEKDAKTRDENASYLTSKLEEIPGISTLKFSKGATRSAYHVYPFRYHENAFQGLSKTKFVRAMRAEGIPCGGGYRPPATFQVFEEQLNSRGFQRLFSKTRLDEYRDQSQLPDNDRLCSETVTLSQSTLLGSSKDMDDIVNAIHKLRENADRVSRA